MANNRTVSIVSGVVLRNTLGLADKNLKDRKVEPKNKPSEPLAYSLADVVEKCGDLIVNHLKEVSEDEEMDELKLQKIREEVRKLRIDNDVQESLLVPAYDVEITITKGLRSIADSLDAITSQFVMQNPDATPAMKDSINRIVIVIRNNIVKNGIVGNANSD